MVRALARQEIERIARAETAADASPAEFPPERWLSHERAQQLAEMSVVLDVDAIREAADKIAQRRPPEEVAASLGYQGAEPDMARRIVGFPTESRRAAQPEPLVANTSWVSAMAPRHAERQARPAAARPKRAHCWRRTVRWLCHILRRPAESQWNGVQHCRAVRAAGAVDWARRHASHSVPPTDAHVITQT